MKYLFFKEKESSTRAKVNLVYFEQPPKELIDSMMYITINDFIEPEVIPDKVAVLYCNPTDFTIWYEYVDAPKTPEQQRIALLEKALNDLIMGG